MLVTALVTGNALLWCLVLFDVAFSKTVAFASTFIGVVVCAAGAHHFGRTVPTQAQAVKAMSTFKVYDVQTLKDSECSICLLRYKNNEELCQLDCKHIFHSKCFKEWNKDCPFRCKIELERRLSSGELDV